MKFSEHDIKQINEETLSKLERDQLLSFAVSLLDDFNEAMDRLNQNSNNSSRPPSTTAPWDSRKGDDQNANDDGLADDDDDGDGEPGSTDETNPSDSEADSAEPAIDLSTNAEELDEAGTSTEPMPTTTVKRTAGKQKGAQGYGRTQQLPITETINHAASNCALCNFSLDGYEMQSAWTAFYSIDIAERVPEKPGIVLSNTKHVFFEILCECGHHNRVEPYRAMPDVNWPKTHLCEWRLVAPRLAAMIVLLSKRHRQSRARISEFLLVFLGLELSVGTIDQTIREAARSAAPLEDEIISDIEKAALVYADETSWKEAGVLRWLWVFRTLTTVFFSVGKRDQKIFCKILLNGRFNGIVMSDGWVVYRQYDNRLRCWAHLIRKARGLSESYDQQAAKEGLLMLTLLKTFQNAIYDARNQDKQSPGSLVEQYQEHIDQLKALCTKHQDSTHKKLRAFAREMLNDWDIILRPMHEPSLPLTNNDAEQILRHWVIDRRLSYGTRTQEGTQSFTILASVIETCRARGAPAWEFLTQIIKVARCGAQLPSLPAIQV